MTFQPMIAVVAALLLASKVWGNTHPSELVAASATVRDQYRTGEDRHMEATDRLTKVHPLANKDSNKFESNDSLLEFTNKETERKKVNKIRKLNHVHKRSYYPYNSNSMQSIAPPFQSITVWQPKIVVDRPYFIPVYGEAGKYPIYFPPQPLYFNPGHPPNNPIPFRGPQYLPPPPPVTPPTSTSTSQPSNHTDTSTTLDNRNFEEEPVWGTVPPNMNDNIIPTRRPLPPGFEVTYPPLEHKPQNNNQRPPTQNFQPPITSPPLTTTTRPSRPPPPTRPPPPPPPTRPGPSVCVWAIIECCSPINDRVNEECFRERGCPGPFWDRTPCAREYTDQALDIALKYYSN